MNASFDKYRLCPYEHARYDTCTTKTRPQHRELHALLFTISVWVLLRPLLTIFNTGDAGDGAYGYSPCPTEALKV